MANVKDKMVTINDIAAKLGVSKATVSLVLNKKAEDVRISAKTREAVLKTARDMGFRKNALARSMTTGKSNVIGFITKDAKSSYNAEPLSAAMQEADQNKYLIKLIHVSPKIDCEEKANLCIENRLAGVIICRAMEAQNLARFLNLMREFSIPVSTIGLTIPPNFSGIEVNNDDKHGCSAAVNHLFKNGHRDIAIVAIHPNLSYSQLRISYFKQRILELNLNLPEENIIIAPKMEDLATRLEAYQNSVKRMPSGIVCVSDPVAMTTMRHFRKAGFKIPDDISIIGYGNLDMGVYSDITLTTIDEPYEQIGKAACSLLIKQIQSPALFAEENKIKRKLLKGKLIQRES